MFRLRPFITFVLAWLSIFCFGTASFTVHGSPFTSPNASAKCVGQWYDVTSHSKAPWIGFRICNISAHSRLSLSGVGTARSLALPLPIKQPFGAGWVRLNREKNGCDVILVKAATSSANGKTCSWRVSTAAGKTVASGAFKISNKSLKPFAPPQSRPKPKR